MTRSFLSRLRFLRKDENGTATIEFVLLFPIYVYMLCTAFEVGMLFVKKSMLDRGLYETARILKVGNYPGDWDSPPTYKNVKDQVCLLTPIIPNCQSVLNLELFEIGNLWTAAPGSFDQFNVGIRCMNRTTEIEPAHIFNAGQRDNIVLMRACVIIDPFFSKPALVMRGGPSGVELTNLSGVSDDLKSSRDKAGTGGFFIQSRSAFANEP